MLLVLGKPLGAALGVSSTAPTVKTCSMCGAGAYGSSLLFHRPLGIIMETLRTSQGVLLS